MNHDKEKQDGLKPKPADPILSDDTPAEWKHSVTGVFSENGPVETRDVIVHTFTGTIARARKNLQASAH